MKRLLSVCCAAATLLAGPAAAADRVVVAMFAANLSPPTVLALDTGAFAAEGLAVEIFPTETATAGAMAVVSGDAQFASMAFSAALFNLAGKGALRIIAGTVREEPGYRNTAYVVTQAAFDAGLRAPRDLIGRSVGITTVGSPLHYALGALALKYGADPAAMRLTPLQSPGALAAALKSGRVEAAVLPPVMAERMAEDGSARIVGWVKDETPHQYGGLFASPALIAGQRSLVERYLRGYRIGARLYHETFLRRDGMGRPIKGENYERFLDLLAARQRVDRRQAEALIAFNDPHARLHVQSVFEQIRFWQSQGLVDASVEPRRVVDLSFVDGHLAVPIN